MQPWSPSPAPGAGAVLPRPAAAPSQPRVPRSLGHGRIVENSGETFATLSSRWSWKQSVVCPQQWCPCEDLQCWKCQSILPQPVC